MNNKVGSQQALQELLRVFADLFTFPDRDFCLRVSNGSVDEQIKELSKEVGFPIETDFQKEAQTYEEWITCYNRCFLGTQKPFAPPIESVYKKWTTDETFQVPYKNQKGYLMGDSALHVEHILKSFGLEIPVEFSMMPDHLIILLELLAFLLDNGLINEAQQFCRDHLDWLPHLREAIEELPVNGGLYSTALIALERVLQAFQGYQSCSVIGTKCQTQH